MAARRKPAAAADTPAVEAAPDGGLSLVISSDTPGAVASNIDRLEAEVDALVATFTPENYTGDAARAKSDRAKLNASAKFLHEQRMAFQRKIQEDPRWLFCGRIKALEDKITAAADVPGRIVREREAREKALKRESIEFMWGGKNFGLFPLEKVFDRSWLNKGKSLVEIGAEMDAIITRTYNDLRAIEKYAEDAETLKAHYLECLDVGDTLDYGEQLAKNRARLTREREEREGREHDRRLDEQRREVRRDVAALSRKSALAGLVAEAAADGGREPEPPAPAAREYIIKVSVTESQLIGIRDYLNTQGVEFLVNEITF